MEGCGVRPAAGTVGLRRRESRRNPANPSEALAKPMRRPSEQHAVNTGPLPYPHAVRSEEHTSELQSLRHLVCRLLLEKKKMEPTQMQVFAMSNSVLVLVLFYLFG